MMYAVIIKPKPSKIPGMAPARNYFPTESPHSLAAIMMGTLGGMIGPTVEEAAVSAQA